MLKAISRRINQKDEGFTLIELMVVLVVIGILMAIAIPTFLGAKGKASDKSAEENVRNALTAEKEYYTDNQQYTASSLSSLEPTLSWVGAFTTSTAGNPVYPRVTSPNGGTGANDNVEISAPSASGGCVYIDDEAIAPPSGGTGPKAGTYYAITSTPCVIAGGTGDVAAANSTNTQTGKGSGATPWGSTW